MTTITLEVPDDLAQKLQQFNPATMIGILKQVIVQYHPDTPLLDTQSERERWRQSLLTMPAWSEKEISEIEQAREYVNQWQPRELF